MDADSQFGSTAAGIVRNGLAANAYKLLANFRQLENKGASHG